MRVVSRTQIDGDFEGMDFDHIFALVNGERWQQVENKYRYTYSYCPQVEALEDGGRYFLRVRGFSEDIRVERVS